MKNIAKVIEKQNIHSNLYDGSYYAARAELAPGKLSSGEEAPRMIHWFARELKELIPHSDCRCGFCGNKVESFDIPHCPKCHRSFNE